jgi:hypothetical protein
MRIVIYGLVRALNQARENVEQRSNPGLNSSTNTVNGKRASINKVTTSNRAKRHYWKLRNGKAPPNVKRNVGNHRVYDILVARWNNNTNKPACSRSCIFCLEFMRSLCTEQLEIRRVYYFNEHGEFGLENLKDMQNCQVSRGTITSMDLR